MSKIIQFIKSLFIKKTPPAIITQDESGYYGALPEDFVHADEEDCEMVAGFDIPRAPDGTNSFIKNGSIQYRQNDVSRVSCTITGAMGAYSALTGYEFTLDERKALWDEALRRGANPNVGWFISSATKLVAEYVNDKLPVKVEPKRIMLDSKNHYKAKAFGYSIIGGYRGSPLFRRDRDDDGILQEVSFGEHTYGHCLHWNYYIGKEFERIVDSYPDRKTNIFKIPTANWKKLVENRVFFPDGWIYIVK
jgi:hypothetical protein